MSQQFKSLFVCVKHLKVWIYVHVYVVNIVICQSEFTKLCLKLYLCVYICVVCVGERLLWQAHCNVGLVGNAELWGEIGSDYSEFLHWIIFNPFSVSK